MTMDIDFFVDDKPFTTRKPDLTVFDVLALRALPPDQFILVSPDGIEYRDPDEIVTIHAGDRLTTRKRDPTRPGLPIHYTVNGERQTTDSHRLTVETILRRAGSAASIDTAEIDSYFLEDVSDGRKYENPAHYVDIKDGDKFLAVHVGRTPVA